MNVSFAANGHLIEEAKTISGSFADCSFHILKDSNSATHHIARQLDTLE